MRLSNIFYSGMALLLIHVPANAALWSSTNAVAAPGTATTMTVSLTGDQSTTDAQVDIAIPIGVTTVSVAARNGGLCVILSGTPTRPDVVRVLSPTATGPLPSAATPLCDIRIAPRTSASSGRFIMFHDECAGLTSAGTSSMRCELDTGYLTIRR
jgi:hypothetical protein